MTWVHHHTSDQPMTIKPWNIKWATWRQPLELSRNKLLWWGCCNFFIFLYSGLSCHQDYYFQAHNLTKNVKTDNIQKQLCQKFVGTSNHLSWQMAGTCHHYKNAFTTEFTITNFIEQINRGNLIMTSFTFKLVASSGSKYNNDDNSHENLNYNVILK